MNKRERHRSEEFECGNWVMQNVEIYSGYLALKIDRFLNLLKN
jgi:hypothetical protein